MSKSTIQTFLSALILTWVSFPAAAVEVPAGKAAVIEMVLGPVKLIQDGQASKPKVGQGLDYGATLSTGSNGRVSLRHADKAVTRLAPNTELTLTAPGKKKGTFLRLTQGVIRFLVGRRAPGHSFEVSTPNAVAAVKGTDAEVETDGKETRGTVYHSERERALSLTDLESGKAIDLAPGQSSILKDEKFEVRDLDPRDFDDSDKKFRGLPEPKVPGEETVGRGVKERERDNRDGKDKQKEKEKERAREALKDKDKDKADLEKRESESTTESGEAKTVEGLKLADGSLLLKETEALRFTEIIQDTFDDVKQDIGLDQTLEGDDRNGDLVAGRVAYDRFGDRTQISSYVQRPDAATIVKSTYSKRDSGPFAGTSGAVETTVWNLKLPEDWTSVAQRPIGDKANLDKYGNPIYYLRSQQFTATNPFKDAMTVDRKYQAPYYLALDDGRGGFLTGALLPQGYSQSLAFNGQQVFQFDWLADADSLAIAAYNASGTVRRIAGAHQATGDAWTSAVTTGKDGATLISYVVGGKTILRTEIRILTEKGELVPAAKFVDNPQFLRDFKGLDNMLNVELTFNSGYLGAPIDLMVIPAIFDMMDFFDVPQVNG